MAGEASVASVPSFCNQLQEGATQLETECDQLQE